jgi:hypothetical protein
LLFNARNTLRQHPEAVLSTLIDLYGLDTSFPQFAQSLTITDVYQRVAHLEHALKEAVVSQVGCRAERFLPHIQPHEFEGLLFSDVDALVGIEPDWARSLPNLKWVRAQAISPEHINNGHETAPSKRLEVMLKPKYKKTRHGPLAASRITLEVMERECTHFKRWMDQLRGLAGPPD